MFDMRNMYKVTVFMNESFSELHQKLKGLGFTMERDRVLGYRMDGYTYRIEAMKPNRGINGFKIFFDCSADVGIYLIDQSIGCYNPIVQAIECQIYEPNADKRQLSQRVRANPKLSQSLIEGVYRKEDVGIIVLDEIIHLQLRALKGKSLHLYKEMFKMVSVKKLLQPANEKDLFSFMDMYKGDVS